jgi:hypothetical protein
LRVHRKNKDGVAETKNKNRQICRLQLQKNTDSFNLLSSFSNESKDWLHCKIWLVETLECPHTKDVIFLLNIRYTLWFLNHHNVRIVFMSIFQLLVYQNVWFLHWPAVIYFFWWHGLVNNNSTNFIYELLNWSSNKVALVVHGNCHVFVC